MIELESFTIKTKINVIINDTYNTLGTLRLKKNTTKNVNKNLPMRMSELTGDDVSEQEYQTVIIDWKSTSWGWTADKKRDFQKQLQLVLYKHYWCKINNLDLIHYY